MEALAVDEALRQRMGDAARSLVLDHSFEQQTSEFLRLYEEVCAGKSER
jgi:hypothetical protein